MDIKSTYLNGLITEEIYMKQPVGYEEKGSKTKVAKGPIWVKASMTQVVCHPAWLPDYDFLIQIGFHHTHADHCIFIFVWGKSTIMIPVYVNDKLLAGNDESLLELIQASIGAWFKTSDLGIVLWILGICIWHNIAQGALFIDQAQYIKGILSCYQMTDCTPVSTPLPAKTQFQPATPEDHLEVSSYLEVIVSLMYAALGTCPDISAVVHSLAPFASSFGKKHIDGVKHIMRYLSGVGRNSLYRMHHWFLTHFQGLHNTHSTCFIFIYTYFHLALFPACAVTLVGPVTCDLLGFVWNSSNTQSPDFTSSQQLVKQPPTIWVPLESWEWGEFGHCSCSAQFDA